MTAGYLHDPEYGTCIARFTDDFQVFDCCRDGDGRLLGTLRGNTIYALDGVTVLGRLGLLGTGGTLPATFRALLK
jgi:hypothetical protein